MTETVDNAPLMDDLAFPDTTPSDPDAHLFNDDVEGADDLGVPVESVAGSETHTWEGQ